MGLSGADLEYRKQLFLAGIDPEDAQGYDSTRLEQIIDSDLSSGGGSVASVNGDEGPAVVLDQDDILDGTTAKQYTSTEKTKLAGIATGATANSSDAALLSRDNHTGTQTASTISDFNTAADARVVAGITGKQNLDSDLTDIAALSPADDTVIQRVAGSWAARTMAQLKTSLGLVKGDVGLGNVDNTADTVKPVSTAQQTALDGKKTDSMATNKLLGRGTSGTGAIEEITLGANIGLSGTTLNVTGGAGDVTAAANFANDNRVLRSDGTLKGAQASGVTIDDSNVMSGFTAAASTVGLGNVDNTSDANKPVSTAQQTALDGKQPLDSDLTTIAGLTATTDNIMQAAGSAWASRTPAQVRSSLGLDLGNMASASQSLPASATTLMTGTSIALATQPLRVGMRFKWTFQLNKTTAAGTATWQALVKFGTANTTADGTICAWTSGTNTAIVDTVNVIIYVEILTLGSGTSATCKGLAMTQNWKGTATTGLSTLPAAGTASGFNSTLASPFIHLSILHGASIVSTGWGAVEVVA